MKLAKELKSIADDLQCTGFFACPGVDTKNRIYDMRTCCNCAAHIRLMRIVKQLEKGG